MSTSLFRVNIWPLKRLKSWSRKCTKICTKGKRKTMMNDMHGNKSHKPIIYKDTRAERAAAEAEAERWKKEALEKQNRKNLELLESESEKVDLEGSKRI